MPPRMTGARYTINPVRAQSCMASNSKQIIDEREFFLLTFEYISSVFLAHLDPDLAASINCFCLVLLSA